MKYKKDLKISLRFRANRKQFESLNTLASIQGISTAQVLRKLIELESERARLK